MSLRILMCCHLPLDPKLGGAKVYIENAKAYENHGHQVTLLGIDDLGEKFSHLPLEERLKRYPLKLREYLQENSSKFNIVEYEYLYHPFLKPISAEKTIFVARSVLLEFHLLDFKLPQINNLPPLSWMKALKQKYLLRRRLRQGVKTINYSDLVNVPNEKDKERLIIEGISEEKIIVSPYGSFYQPQVLNNHPDRNLLGYIASFDPRKGCLDLPKILRDSPPQTNLMLFGAKGRFQSQESILNTFDSKLRKRVRVSMSFESEMLDQILANCGIGIFPSYLESFGFGLLEFTQRGIPVIAYDVPGPSDLLPDYLLVERGDTLHLNELIKHLQTDDIFYQKARTECLEISKQYEWKTTSLPALKKYLES